MIRTSLASLMCVVENNLTAAVPLPDLQKYVFMRLSKQADMYVLEKYRETWKKNSGIWTTEKSVASGLKNLVSHQWREYIQVGKI